MLNLRFPIKFVSKILWLLKKVNIFLVIFDIFLVSEIMDYEDLDKMVREEGKKPKGEVFCPECGSHRLYYFVGGRAGWIYECKNCGYHGSVVIEDSKIAKDLWKRWKKGVKEDEDI